MVERILARIRELEKETGIKRTLFAVCPNSRSVIKAALRSAKRCNAPVKFAATLNQVDLRRDRAFKYRKSHGKVFLQVQPVRCE